MPYQSPFYVSLIQPSIPQSLKWDPDKRIPTLKTYTRLTKQAKGTLIVWPETAVPDFLHRVETEWLNPLTQELATRSTNLIVGAPVLDADGNTYYNGAVLLGTNFAAYYKRHLVPFGEYLPFKSLLGSVLKFLRIPMSNFTPGQFNSHSIRINEHIAGISICYEDAFGEEIRASLPEASYLVNLSNDGWFGDSLAPHQHLEISRMRALEMARPLVRATNSGISAIIDSRGNIQASSQLFIETIVTGLIQPMTGKTWFVIWGDTATLIIALILISLATAISNFH
jgi:apolipoprotein N-acyltransferase